MLSSLNITNIALIDKLELELMPGLNILSGETGAGKSIIIDSLNFVLGERADKGLMRNGAEFAAVEAVFSDYENEAVSAYLSGIGVEEEEILILRRKMSQDGKNECRINGKLTTLSVLRNLTELLVDIHGQHEHQSLLKPANHIVMLDGLGGTEKEKADVCAAYKNYRALKEELDSLGDDRERERKLDVLSYQIEEIEKAEIKEGEEDELLDKRRRIRNMEKILEGLNGAKNTLDGYDGGAVTGSIKNAIGELTSVSDFDEEISDLTERLYAAKTEIEDISETLSGMLDRLDFDAKTADKVEERLEIVRNIQRKYGGSFEAVGEFLKNAKEEADMLSNAGERVALLENLIKDAARELERAAECLTKKRLETARSFERAMVKELGDLGMSGSSFKVDIQTSRKADDIGENGADRVEFLISPNMGEPLKPLVKIISGGEMSRFMLALKNIVAGKDGIGTMVFDEIDTGISGKISQVVSEKLCNISRMRQVIAVTHMPSLAAMADHHYLIEKSAENGKTLTHVKRLKDDIDEIARLIGGSDYSEHAVPHAREMRAWADKYKASLKIAER